MKKLLAILFSLMLMPIVIHAEEEAINLELTGEIDINLAEQLEEYAERADRMDRCVRKLQSEFPDKQARAQFACERFYTAYDNRLALQARLKDEGVDGELVEKLSRLQEERRERIQVLDDNLRDRLAKLDTAELERLSVMKQERLERIEDLDDAQLERLAKLTRAQLKDYENDDNWEERLRSTISARGTTDDVGRKRALSDDTIKKARDRYEAAQERFENRKQEYEQARERFKELADEEREACEQAGAECDAARAESIEKAKEFLTALGEQEIAYLEDLIAQIEANEGYTNNDAAEQVADLNEQIEKINQAIDLLNDAETKGEVKDAGQIIINTWRRMEIRALDYRQELAYRTAKNYVRRGEALEIKLDNLIARVEDAGIDLSEIDEDVELFSQQIETANEYLSKGQDYFTEFRNADSPDRGKLAQAQEQFRLASQSLQEADKTLMKIKRKIFSLSGEDFEADDDEEVEIIIERKDDIPDSPEFTEEVEA